MTATVSRSLDEQRADFAGRRLIATPIAGLIVWTVIGIAGAVLDPVAAVWVLFIGTGSHGLSWDVYFQIYRREFPR